MRVSAGRECRHLRRHPWDLALASWIPWLLMGLVMMVLLAGALRHLPIAVVDHDQSETSRALVRKLSAAPGVYVKEMPESLDEAFSRVRSLDVYAVVYIPQDVSRQMARGASGTIFAYFDASHLTMGQGAVREISSVLQAQNLESTRAVQQYVHERSSLAAVPVQVQSTILFNAARSYEHFLLGLVMPAILQLAFCLAVVAAIGRELRDGTAQAWLQHSGQRFLAAVAGKILPYFVLFMLYGGASIVWLAWVRGDGIAGSVFMLMLGYATMYAAYIGVALLFVGATRNMATALSLTGIYTGVALAFSGGTFPITGAVTFTQTWTHLLPFTAYVKLQMQQLDMGAPWTVSMQEIGVLLIFVVLLAPVGLRLLARAARDPSSWGQR